MARIRLDYFICDKITEIPNIQGFHGIFPDKRDPVDPKINHTTRVSPALNSAFRCRTMALMPMIRPNTVASLFSCASTPKPWKCAGSVW